MFFPNRLASKIIIEELVPNYQEPVWRTRWLVSAEIKSLFNYRFIASEIAIAKKLVSSNFYEFTIRYRKELNQDMRIIYDNRTFNITKIIEDFVHKRFQKIIAEEQGKPAMEYEVEA